MKSKSIERGINIAVKNPEAGVSCLARTFAQYFQGGPWVNRDLKLRFCILYLRNLLDRSVEKEIDSGLLERVIKKPIIFGIRILKRNPEEGLKILIAVVMRELRCKQNYSYLELHSFYEEVIAVFFPDEVEEAANNPKLEPSNQNMECA
ncbi:MAG: hypothetical protein LBI42_14575 [Chitinispirillales bacterium]|jgi:hypothetical protein|nr:hypothetical protein [Chitinispirillales bacterium]